jgi:hypothetical protein
MQANGIRVVDSIPDIPLRTTKDQLTVPVFVRSSGFSILLSELVRLNKIRSCLKAATIADLVGADGRLLLHEVWHGTGPTNSRPSIDWPKQRPLPPGGWKLWQNALTSCLGTSKSQQLGPNYNAGTWIDNDEQWEWFYHTNTKRLYRRIGEGWKCWRRIPSRNTVSRFINPEEPNDIPSNLVRVSVAVQRPMRCLQSTATTLNTIPTTSPQNEPSRPTLNSIITALLEDAQWAVKEWYCIAEISTTTGTLWQQHYSFQKEHYALKTL